MIPADPAGRHRTVAAGFAERVEGTRDWKAPTPVAGWVAADVVEHLLDWLPGLLATGGVHLPDRAPTGPATTDPDAGALPARWRARAAAVQALLDDPTAAAATFEHPNLPPLPLAAAIDRFYTVDVFMHTWDLSRATGQDDRLDPQLCTDLLAGMTPMEDLLRSSGHYGPRVPVDPSADPCSRLIGFIGRDPGWRADLPGPPPR